MKSAFAPAANLINEQGKPNHLGFDYVAGLHFVRFISLPLFVGQLLESLYARRFENPKLTER